MSNRMCRMFVTGAVCVIILLALGGRRPIFSQAIRDTAVINSYPKLYNALYRRDASRILSFTSDSSALIRTQAWHALAQTPVDSLSEFISKVKHDGSKQAWFALSMHELAAPLLRDLEQYWKNRPADRAGVSLVLGQQGDEQTLAFLLGQLPNIHKSHYEKPGAMAIGRLLNKYQSGKSQQASVIEAAFSAKNELLTRAWLYGYYRGAKTKLTPAQKDTIRAKWEAYGVGKNTGVDQYVAKILGPAVFAEIINHYKTELQKHVQLGVELAHSAAEVPLNSTNRRAIKTLLDQPNVHVVKQTLAGLSGSIQRGETLFRYIKTNILDTDSTADVIWLQALNTLAECDSSVVANYKNRLSGISEHRPYLYPAVLNVQMKSEKPAVFLEHIANAIGEADHLKSMYALNALNEFLSQKEHRQKAFRSQVRSTVFKALAMEDRGVAFASEALLEDSLLFSASDFPKINGYLSAFRLPGDVEVYQAFGALYKKRFPEQAQTVIDSLAAKNYAPLNRSLKQSGWNVQVPNVKKNFRQPNWDRLWALGRRPMWVLESDRGIIKVQMNTLSAPATVSAIDSLTRAGAYNGVPFHRVVPNFVIQGGDIERQDGLGGPDFVIPTEPSEHGFVRGAAGIASAGPDTEGSQYFFMLQRAPHLNGRYTLFGQVVEGMDVVDRMVVGDKVEKAYWQRFF